MPMDGSLSDRPLSPLIDESVAELGKRDKNFRRYASAVERALSLFDTALQEWADYISFLGRLLKALHTKPSGVDEIPHSRLVAKRLSQCLNPMLQPSVHQKALEVYALVFAILNVKGLSKELPLYLPGLSPLLSFASMSVKPGLLSLFERYIVVLEPVTLQPALKAIVLALLPGLEEEGSDEFERTHTLFNKLRGPVEDYSSANIESINSARDRLFWQSLFLATITSSSRRQGALAYLDRNLPRLGNIPSGEDDSYYAKHIEENHKPLRLPIQVEVTLSPEPGLLVRCFVAGLQDAHLLVQRGFLDLLVTHLPLNSAVLQQRVSDRDLELLVAGAASVVTRREMSLNRRLWVWFLGKVDESASNSPESGPSLIQRKESSESPVQYFVRYGLTPLINFLLKSLRTDAESPAIRAKPFRICSSLMDRWEIGGLVVPRVFRPAMESIYTYEDNTPSKEAFSEVLRSANVFFDGIQSQLIWKEIILLLVDALDAQMFKVESSHFRWAQARIGLVRFIVTKFSIHDQEILEMHVPNTVLFILTSIQNLYASHTCKPDMAPVINNALRLSIYLVDHIPQTSTSNPAEQETASQSETLKRFQRSQQDIPSMIRNSYEGPDKLPGNDLDIFSSREIQVIILPRTIDLIDMLLDSPESAGSLDLVSTLAMKLIAKTEALHNFEIDRLMTRLAQAGSRCRSSDLPDFSDLLGHTASLEIINKIIPTEQWHSEHLIRKSITELVTNLWAHLSPLTLRHNVEAVRCLWRMHQISPDDQLIEATITSLMHGQHTWTRNQQISIDGARKFVTLWNHSIKGTSPTSNVRPQSARTNSIGDTGLGKPDQSPGLLARPLLLILESLSEPKSEAFMIIDDWMQSLPNIHLILDFMINRLHTSPYLMYVLEKDKHASNGAAGSATESTNQPEESIYYLELISGLIQLRSDFLLSALKVQTAIHPSIMDESLRGELLVSTNSVAEDAESLLTIQEYLLSAPLIILIYSTLRNHDNIRVRELWEACVTLLRRLVTVLGQIPAEKKSLETQLIQILSWAVEQMETRLQVDIMDLLSLLVNATFASSQPKSIPASSNMSRETQQSLSRLSLSTERSDRDQKQTAAVSPDPSLLDCLLLGLSSPNSQPILDHWVGFLESCLPLYATSIFQIILPLAGCISNRTKIVFESIQKSFEKQASRSAISSEPLQSLNVLFNALEMVIAKGHDQVLNDEAKMSSLKTPEQVQGFFGNMVSGVFSVDAQTARSATANNRLTVLLCFKDAVRVAFGVWSWGVNREGLSSLDMTTSASFNYTSVRLRNRTRRALEHLFTAEPLECLETLIELRQSTTVNLEITMSLLHTLEASRPKNTMPAIFNAIYSRTNPSILDPSRKSTLTSDLSDLDLAVFLVAYTKSMDDDALDEVWADCVTFLRDVLGNPMPHRQILPLLLDFIAVLGGKIDNTNFGEQRRMRKDIGDLFVRLLAANFTTKPLSFSQDPPALAIDKVYGTGQPDSSIKHNTNPQTDVVVIMASTLPNMSKLLVDTERIVPVVNTISFQILMPTFRWKTFPHNISIHTLQIVQILSRITEAAKIWKKDVAEAFNDPRFFSSRSLPLLETGWMPIMRQWTLLDRDRMSEMLSRLSAPASAGIMFGVGASSVRLEADRKAQINLRRIAFLALSAADDAFVASIPSVQEKLTDLLNATAASSPSSVTRAEVYMVLRSLILKNSPEHIASLWPLINAELYEALGSISQIASRETYNITCILQAAKLLDTILVIAPDDFQLREWLFVTDTIDAVYRPSNWKPVALVDILAEVLDIEANPALSATISFSAESSKGVQKPLLRWDATHGVPREKLLDQVLRPFLRQLSISVFESTYQMEMPDKKACCDELLKDLFDDNSLV